jgi:hypothetical protein
MKKLNNALIAILPITLLHGEWEKAVVQFK